MAKFIETWPYEFWDEAALGGLLIVGLLLVAVAIISKAIDDGIKRAGYERKGQSDTEESTEN